MDKRQSGSTEASDRSRFKHELKARVEEFYNHNHAEDGRFSEVDGEASESGSREGDDIHSAWDALERAADKERGEANTIHQRGTASAQQSHTDTANNLTHAYDRDIKAAQSEIRSLEGQMGSGYHTWVDLADRLNEAHSNLDDTRYSWEDEAVYDSQGNYATDQRVYRDNYGNVVNKMDRQRMEGQARNIERHIMILEDQYRNGEHRYAPIQNRHGELIQYLSERADSYRGATAQNDLRLSRAKAGLNQELSSKLNSIDTGLKLQGKQRVDAASVPLSAAKGAAVALAKSVKDATAQRDAETARIHKDATKVVDSVTKEISRAHTNRDLEVSKLNREADAQVAEIKRKPNEVLTPEERLMLLQPGGSVHNERFTEKVEENKAKIRAQADRKIAAVRVSASESVQQKGQQLNKIEADTNASVEAVRESANSKIQDLGKKLHVAEAEASRLQKRYDLESERASNVGQSRRTSMVERSREKKYVRIIQDAKTKAEVSPSSTPATPQPLPSPRSEKIVAVVKEGRSSNDLRELKESHTLILGPKPAPVATVRGIAPKVSAPLTAAERLKRANELIERLDVTKKKAPPAPDGVRTVKTAEGAARYGQPIGSEIKAEDDQRIDNGTYVIENGKVIEKR